MRIDPLRSLLRVRQATTKASKMALSQAIAAEAECRLSLSEAERRILHEADAAMSLGADDGAVEAYARWLPTGRREAKRLSASLQRVSQEVEVARTALTLAKAAEHAIAIQLDQALAEVARSRLKKAQAELDEVASRTVRKE